MEKMLLLLAVSITLAFGQGASSQQAARLDSLWFGSARLTLGMPKPEVERVLAAQSIQLRQEYMGFNGKSYPLDWCLLIGSSSTVGCSSGSRVGFSDDQKLTKITKDLTVSGTRADSLFNGLLEAVEQLPNGYDDSHCTQAYRARAKSQGCGGFVFGASFDVHDVGACPSADPKTACTEHGPIRTISINPFLDTPFAAPLLPGYRVEMSIEIQFLEPGDAGPDITETLEAFMPIAPSQENEPAGKQARPKK